MPLTLTTGECAALAELRQVVFDRYASVDADLDALFGKLARAATPRNGSAAGKRFERRIASELREIVASLPGEWKVARNQTDRQKGQVADGAGEYTIEGPQPFPWAFELKDGAGFCVEHLLSDPIPGPLASTRKREGFWAQAARQAACVGRFPILIVRESGNHRMEFAVLRPVHRAMLLGPNAIRATITVDGERLDVCPWGLVRTAPAERWLSPPPPPPL